MRRTIFAMSPQARTKPKPCLSSPKRSLRYEIFGSAHRANVNYLDLSAQPQRLDGAPLPWALTLSTTAPSVFPNLSAQSDGDFLGCRITVDDEVKYEKTSNGVRRDHSSRRLPPGMLRTQLG